MIEHKDQLGQPIEVGNYVALTYSHSRRVFVGVVTKLTKQRVKMAFTNTCEYKGETHNYQTRHLARPADILILGDTLPQHLTLATLQKKI